MLFTLRKAVLTVITILGLLNTFGRQDHFVITGKLIVLSLLGRY